MTLSATEKRKRPVEAGGRSSRILAAMILVSELGEVHRFAHPRQVMAYLGLVPTENVLTTRAVSGSIFATAPSTLSATHTAPSPTAIPDGPFPT